MRHLSLALFFSILFHCTFAQSNFSIIGYYHGFNPDQLDSFPIEKLTHIIFSFCHLKENKMSVDDSGDTAAIQKMVSLKARNPNLKVILSLGGWGGCATCSDVFSSDEDRQAFAESAKNLCEYFGADGIDLDWEYPVIPGHPGHKYQPADKENFTRLVMQLRKTLGRKYEISFAAGGFEKYIENSIEWKKVMKEVNHVNLMTYDLVNGFDTVTGHHTPLYSTSYQKESVNNAVRGLIHLGVPKHQIIIGAAFYGRIWENVADTAFGKYQMGKFEGDVAFKNIETLIADSGFVYHWDSIAQAPFLYQPFRKLFVTYDDKKSVTLKTKYALEKGLGGIMFWQLGDDSFHDGLLDAIDEAKRDYFSQRRKESLY